MNSGVNARIKMDRHTMIVLSTDQITAAISLLRISWWVVTGRVCIR